MSITTLHSTFLILRCLITEVGFTAPQLKPCFYLFQRVWDQLYLTPPSLEEHISSLAAYLGALGFTKHLERLVLPAVPLKSLLEWLLKPRGPNLVEATTGSVPEKSLVLAMTRRMLYGEDPPFVGVGLMYKPHYISTESFCIAYMHLNVWHAAASSEDSVDKLDSSCFILVSVSEMSNVVPVEMPAPSSWTWEARRSWRKLANPWVPSGFEVSGSTLCGAGHLGGACSSDRLSSPLGGCHCTHAGVQAREVSPEHAAGA